MPPKKGTSAQKQPKAEAVKSPDPPKEEIKTKADPPAQNGAANSKKRKTPSAEAPASPHKSARRSGRSGPKSQPSQLQLLNYMLSPAATSLCRPEDETKDLESRGEKIKTYSSGPAHMTPFEELLCAVILSRPISHRLGLRTIRTILNAPYNFSTPKAIQAAGGEKVHQSLWDARTQHKAKTAEQISNVADVVLSDCTAEGDKEGTQLGKLLKESGGDVDKALDILKEKIKGLGDTGLKIFLRRVQWLPGWEGGFPYVDDRTGLSLRKLGLPEEAAELRKVVEANWGKLEQKGLEGKGEAERKRRAFVVVLERAIGADLEGKVDEMVAEAAKA